MRVRTMGFAALLCAAVGAAGMAQLAAQSGFDRPGGDYASAPVANGDPAVCAARCEQDKGCRSWSFSYPSTSGEPAMCWLKRDVVPRAQANCCVSGVRGGRVIEPLLGQFEYSIDRAGGDYRSFELADDPDGKACAAACQAEFTLPRLDLPAAGLRLDGAALLPQRDDQAAAPPAMLHFRRSAVMRASEAALTLLNAGKEARQTQPRRPSPERLVSDRKVPRSDQGFDPSHQVADRQ